MKAIINSLSGIGLLGILLMSGCGGDDSSDVSPEQEVIDALSKEWSPSSVTFQNDNVATDWSQFKLTFDQSQGYTATALSEESILVWPASGTYTFPQANNPNLILRDDGVEITIESISDTSTRLIFTITGRNEGGRDEGLLGEWIFELGN